MKATYDGKSRTYNISLTDTDLGIFSGQVSPVGVEPWRLNSQMELAGLEHQVEFILENGRYVGKSSFNTERFSLAYSHDDSFRVTEVRMTLNNFDDAGFGVHQFYGATTTLPSGNKVHVKMTKE